MIELTGTYDATFMLAGTAFILAAFMVWGIALRRRYQELYGDQYLSLERLP